MTVVATVLGALGVVLELVLRAVDAPPAAEDIKPGWIALVTVIALGVATVLLWLSMRKRLGKIRFEDRPRSDGDGPAGS